MSIFRSLLQIILIVLTISSIQTSVNSTKFTFVNRCGYTVYPGTLSGSSSPRLETTGFQLQSGESLSLQAPPSWSGRFWGRTGCNFDPVTGQGSCTTANCRSNQLECNGAGAIPPATLAEFTIGNSGDSKDFYDVSLVDGFNLPMLIEPSGGSGDCSAPGCAVDFNKACPSELQSGGGGGCRSACEAFGTAEYCCSGEYGSPSTCKPSVYSQMFKAACPSAYSYAYDDGTSTFTCSGADYTITFCPSSTTSLKSSTPMVPTPSLTSPPPTRTTVAPPQSEQAVPATPARAMDVTGGGYIVDTFGSGSFTGDASKTLASIAMAASSILFYFILVRVE